MLNGWKRGSGCPCGGAGDLARMPLCEAKTGKRLKVAGIEGGRHFCARMASMGIYPGVEMEILCGGCGCPCLVKVHGGTFSLGKGMSDKIMVTSVM